MATNNPSARKCLEEGLGKQLRQKSVEMEIYNYYDQRYYANQD